MCASACFGDPSFLIGALGDPGSGDGNLGIAGFSLPAALGFPHFLPLMREFITRHKAYNKHDTGTGSGAHAIAHRAVVVACATDGLVSPLPVSLLAGYLNPPSFLGQR